MNDKEIDIVQALANAADKIAEERDELLGALKMMVDACELFLSPKWLNLFSEGLDDTTLVEFNQLLAKMLRAMNTARAAIAKAEGK